MAKNRDNPALNKVFITTQQGYDVYSVNAFAIRNLAKPDEEFTNFATRDEFPDLIPKGEIWIADRSVDKEGIFFIVNALARLKEKAKGAPQEKAYTAGVNIERSVRGMLGNMKFQGGRPQGRVPEQLYIQHYITLPDTKFAIEVWVVDGNQVRSRYKTDYTEGGHGYVYPWIPKKQIWIERDLDRAEMPFIASHEYLELRLMRDKKIKYDKAHETCSKIEFMLRKDRGIRSFLASGDRKLRKKDLTKLVSPELFEHVLENYLTG